MTLPDQRDRAEHNAAEAIANAFQDWHGEFAGMTRRARGRFARREWRAAQQDTRDRLAQHDIAVTRLVSQLRTVSADALPSWAPVRREFAAMIAGWPDAELAGSFFNSATRRLFGKSGLDPAAEFTAETAPQSAPARRLVARPHPFPDFEPRRFAAILQEMDLGAPWSNLERDVTLVSRAVTEQLDAAKLSHAWELLDLLPSPCYRNKGAYLVGRLRGLAAARPLVLALVHDDSGIAIDAVLTDPDEVSAVFGFTRSYFHVELEHPAAAVDFLATLMPNKRRDELWTAIGYHKHGKTELYRELMRHLDGPGARFEPSEGDRGMVMSVFTLPSLNVVFKVIKDRFDPPKHTTRSQVMARYDLVFAHDRVGRLADAQEFQHLAFRRDHFDPVFLAELAREAGKSVVVEGERVVVRHCYTERRVTPLNLYLRSANPTAALAAVIDYGQAVRDLAAANVFPGDMLLKNFGVTRHGRVIFYDYDELCLLTDCRVRNLPEPRAEEDELLGEPWFGVSEGDIFPEEFHRFMVLSGELGEGFLANHAELFTPEFWLEMQARQRAGDIVDFFPYPPARRLPGRPPGHA